MRITILANRDIHSNFAVNFLLPSLRKHKLSIFLSDKVGVPASGYQVPRELKQLKLFEQRLFSQVISPLAKLQPITDGRMLTFEEIGLLAESAIYPCHNINTEDNLAVLENTQPDIILSIRFGSILRKKAIAIPRLGVLNLHSGLLPRYKGILTTLHSLVEGRQKVGCTLHFIDSAEIDAGPIIDTASLEVDPSKSLFWHVQQLYPLGCGLITQALSALSEGKPLTTITQKVDEQVYYSLPTAEDFSRLRKCGFSVWDDSDIEETYKHFILSPTSSS